MNHLYYGDNLDVLRKYIPNESVDLCYIDPPFNSKRNYNQIYTNKGKEDFAQAQAFVDMWVWDDLAIKGFSEIVSNENEVFTAQCINLILGLEKVLGQDSLFAYLISITLRCAEIFRVLKPTGSFYFHCDSSSSHYIKCIIDSIFCPQGGDYLNEIIWKRVHTVKGNYGQGTKRFDSNTDTIFLYSKKQSLNTFNTCLLPYKKEYIEKFYKYTELDGRRYRLISMIGPGGAAKGNPRYEVMGVTRYWRYSEEKMNAMIENGLVVQNKPGNVPQRKQYLDIQKGSSVQSLWEDIKSLSASSKERLGYPTQKPEDLLERIIQVSSNENDVILDAYCGCGTTVAVAQKLNRKWIGIDITYQAVSLILKRLEDAYGSSVLDDVKVAGMPRDIEAATALANRKDDRTRKEFEKWSVLTYTNNRAIINQKKGADKGIDGTVFFLKPDKGHGRIIFQVKSGNVKSGDIRDLQGTMAREKAEMGIFITLKKPSSAMVKEAKSAGNFHHDVMNRDYPCIDIVTIQDILEGKRLEIPLSLEVIRSAERKQKPVEQLQLLPKVAEDGVNPYAV